MFERLNIDKYNTEKHNGLAWRSAHVLEVCHFLKKNIAFIVFHGGESESK